MTLRPTYARRRAGTITVSLPRVFTLGSLYTMVGRLFQELRGRPEKVILDFQALHEIHVGGITVLSNMIELSRKLGVPIEFKNAEICGARSFLVGTGFAELYLGADPTSSVILDSEFFPLTLVQYDRSYSYVNDKLTPWVARHLGHDVRALSSLKVCFEEIFNNIKDHSTVDVGCSCAHHDKNEDKIKICISDFGVGIPRKVKRLIGSVTDHEAIATACQEGFTTQSTPQNMGAGLHVLIRNVVARNSGSVIIYSGKGIFSCLPSAEYGKCTRTGEVAPHNGLYPGTMIVVTLDPKRFVPSEIEKEEFAWESFEY